MNQLWQLGNSLISLLFFMMAGVQNGKSTSIKTAEISYWYKTCIKLHLTFDIIIMSQKFTVKTSR